MPLSAPRLPRLGHRDRFSRPDPDDEAFAATASCTLARVTTDQPYYLDLAHIRRNLAAGHKGLRLELHLKIVDSTTGEPLPGIA